MNRSFALVAVVGLAAIASAGCSKHSKLPTSPVVVEACIAPHHSSPGLYHTTLVTFKNVSKKAVTRVRFRIDPSNFDAPLRIPIGATRTYSESAIAMSARPECEPWQVFFEDGSRWDAPPHEFWFP